MLFRFGQDVLQDCEHCKTFDEYAVNALPGPLLQYIREGALIGFLTITGSFREKWRTYAMAAIVGAAVLEGYWTITAEIKIPKDGMGTLMVRPPLPVPALCFLVLSNSLYFLYGHDSDSTP